MRLQQNELVVDNNGDPVNIESFNFLRHLQWNNMEKEIDAIPESVFRFWDHKDLKTRLLLCMERNLFFTNSIHKFQNIIHLMISEDLNFKVQTVDGEIKEFKIPAEGAFIDSFSEESFSKTSKMA